MGRIGCRFAERARVTQLDIIARGVRQFGTDAQAALGARLGPQGRDARARAWAGAVILRQGDGELWRDFSAALFDSD